MSVRLTAAPAPAAAPPLPVGGKRLKTEAAPAPAPAPAPPQPGEPTPEEQAPYQPTLAEVLEFSKTRARTYRRHGNLDHVKVDSGGWQEREWPPELKGLAREAWQQLSPEDQKLLAKTGWIRRSLLLYGRRGRR